MTMVMDGKLVANRVLDEVRSQVEAAAAEGRRPPRLVVVRVGDDPASEVYVRGKRRSARRVGITAEERWLPATASQAEVERQVAGLAADREVDGILVQLPLPGGLDPEAVLAQIPAEKDVDGLTEPNLGALVAGRPRFAPCTPRGVMRLLEHYQVPLAGRRAVVVGRSRLVGLPTALLLNQANASVTVVHRSTPEPWAVAREADVLVVAAGHAGLVDETWVKPGAAVVDVGIHRLPAGLVGDVRFDAVSERAGLITPVPGGVGPLTVAMLLDNTVLAHRRRMEKA